MTSSPAVPVYTLTRPQDAPLDPPPLFAQLREEQPITRVFLRGRLTPWLVTRWEDARAVLGSKAFSVDPSLPGAPSFWEGQTQLSRGFFLHHDGPGHAAMRRTLTREFMVKRIDALRPAIARMTDELLTDLTKLSGPADFMEHFALPLPTLVICELLGVPYEDHAFLQEESYKLVDLDALPEEHERAFASLGEYLLRLVRAKRATPGDDVVTRLAAQADEGVITDQDAADMSTLVLFGGHETTANMIALSTITLLNHPDLIPYILGGPDQVASAVEELLRYLSAVHGGMRRTAIEDVTIGGVTIHAGEGVIVPLGVANRDPELFSNPDDLAPERANVRAHVAFGYGVHQCIGQTLARAELQIALSEVFRRLPDLKIAVPMDELAFKPTSAVYGVRELPVTW
ncbi:cytochrome P450 [Streptomyces ipomoeae]|uniref:cytochrome P450 n=1 Tax=Streptomyces ipomoeae TaxID=103232 RepID=UPI0011473E96|nr:cytochrome P450 [Streptomyces ipomoeae]MDX2939314.1 cytochrome P450 [Streptomyces ipomoeae]TQE29278.1 cytochrome P450 [Streptomyces ipomoeae]